jgi:competence ComEA-like helix-hairpin-helix protein
MRLLRVFQERFGFTRNELTAVLVLATVFLAGSAIKLWMPAISPRPALPAFSYAALDSQFLALSRAPRDTVPAPGLPPARKSATPPALQSIELNSATVEDLQRLPGIGPVIAQRIVAYRAEHGDFSVLDNLSSVKGIGPRTFERIRAYLVVRPHVQYTQP